MPRSVYVGGERTPGILRREEFLVFKHSSDRCGEKKNLVALPVTEPQTLSRLARSLITISTELSRHMNIKLYFLIVSGLPCIKTAGSAEQDFQRTSGCCKCPKESLTLSESAFLFPLGTLSHDTLATHIRFCSMHLVTILRSGNLNYSSSFFYNLIPVIYIPLTYHTKCCFSSLRSILFIWLIAIISHKTCLIGSHLYVVLCKYKHSHVVIGLLFVFQVKQIIKISTGSIVGARGSVVG
jgi:hypothetical protein